MTLHPDIAVITAADADHLDIYGSADSLKDSFKDFIKNIKKNGKLFIEERAADKIDLKSLEGIDYETYGLENGQIRTLNLSVIDEIFHFDFQSWSMLLKSLSMPLPGFHNI